MNGLNGQDRKLDILKKLKALADRGILGEKENAELCLKKLMKKYNINDEQLESTVRKRRYIKYKFDYECRLISQILYSMIPELPSYIPKDRRRSYIIVDLSESEYIEFSYLYSIYKADFYKELDYFYSSFVGKNSIYPKETPKDLPKEKELTMDEKMKLSSYAEGIDRSKVRKSIGGK